MFGKELFIWCTMRAFPRTFVILYVCFFLLVLIVGLVVGCEI